MLNIDMDPKTVDVNVHPAKLEVRFEDENKVFKAIYHAIKSGLMESELIANVEKTDESEEVNNEGFKKLNIEENTKNNVISNDEYIKDEEKHMGFSGVFHRKDIEPKETPKKFTRRNI